MNHFAALFAATFALLLCVAGDVAAASTTALRAAGDKAHLWVLRPADDQTGYIVMHRPAGADVDNQLKRIATLRGGLLPAGVASQGDMLWMVYEGFAVQSVQVLTDQVLKRPNYMLNREPTLPSRITKLRGFAVTRSGPWALVRIDNAEVLREIDALTAPAASDKTDEDNRDQPGANATITPQPETDTRAEATGPRAAAPTVAAVSTDRLLRLDRGRWQRVPLPPNWQSDADARLVTLQADDDAPLLLAIPPRHVDADSLWMHVYQPRDTEAPWKQYEVDLPDADTAHFIAVDGQLIAAHGKLVDGKLHVSFRSIRHVSGKVNPLEVIEADAALKPEQWTLAAIERSIGLLWLDDRGRLFWRTQDLTGNVMPVATAVSEQTRSASDMGNFALLIVVLFICTLAMLAFWRRDPNWNALELPERTAVADLSLRFVAGVIDLAPGLAAIWLYTGHNPVVTFINHWPGRVTGYDSWQSVIPGAVVIAVTVSHTCLLELLTARSLGKWAVRSRMRVANMTAARPKAWQVLVRNIMKAVELIAFPMLFMALLIPTRQRLGDLVARTVVVMQARPDDEDKPTDNQ